MSAKREIDPVYAEAKRLICDGRSALSGLRFDAGAGGSATWITDEHGRGLKVFASRGAAEKHRETAMAKARRAYHKGQCR